MKKSFLLILFVIAILIGIAVEPLMISTSTTTQGLLPVRNFEEIIYRSYTIIEGTIVDILPPKWSNNSTSTDKKNVICTDILVKVNKIYKNLDKETEYITIRTVGGTIGRDSMGSPDEYKFSLYDKGIIFLTGTYNDVDSGKPVCSLPRGKYSFCSLSNKDKDNILQLEPKVYIDLDTFEEDIDRILAVPYQDYIRNEGRDKGISEEDINEHLEFLSGTGVFEYSNKK